jgi:alkylhydroperoxidase/carboxymuconolactone decarboxylase family protein YurZ
MTTSEANQHLRLARLPPLPRDATEEEIAEALASAAQITDIP